VKILVSVASLTLAVFLYPLFSSVNVFAVSENLVISLVQTSGSSSGTASQEMVLVYNSSSEDIDITGWCLAYSSAANGLTFSELVCVEPPDEFTEIWITANSRASFATSEFVDENIGFVPDFIFSSGLAASGGHLILRDFTNAEVDRVGWGGAVLPEGDASLAHSAGEVLSRNLSLDDIDTDDNSVDFSSQVLVDPVVSGLYEVEVTIDVCPNIDGQQLTIPEGYEKLDGQELCSEIFYEDAAILVTELLINAPSFDTGQEFIELYNPNDVEIDLSGYEIQLGPSYSKTFEISGITILPGQYIAFSDLESGLTLPNSAASIRVIAPAGNIVSETDVYPTSDDDVSWSLVDDLWIFTNQITRQAVNKPFLLPAVDEILGVTSVFAPCPAGKFRNPATNRCKNIETSSSQLALCTAGQTRNPATNRCISTTSATSQLAPCGPDQFRNPATNRCKKVSSASEALAPCAEGKERNPETNRCRNTAVASLTSSGGLPTVEDVAVENTSGSINWPLILLAVIGAGGYMAYEWRSELSHKVSGFRKA